MRAIKEIFQRKKEKPAETSCPAVDLRVYRPSRIALLENDWRLAPNEEERIQKRAELLRYFFNDPNLKENEAKVIATMELRAWAAKKEEEKRRLFLLSNQAINTLTRWKFDPEAATEQEIRINRPRATREEKVNAHAALHALVFSLGEEHSSDLQKASEHYFDAIEHLRSAFAPLIEAAKRSKRTSFSFSPASSEVHRALVKFLDFYAELQEILYVAGVEQRPSKSSRRKTNS